MMIKLATILFAALAAGCYVGGPDVRKLPAAVDQEGARGLAIVGGLAYRGELLTVKDSSLVIRTESARVVEIPLSAARSIDFRPFVRERAGDLREEHITRLRRVSRFPFGIPDAALAEILGRSKSSSVEVIQP